MRILIIIFLLMFILYVSFQKSRKIEKFKIRANINQYLKCRRFNRKRNGQFKKFLDILANKVAKLEYLLHRSSYHNKIKNKIEAIEKKYDKAYKWYRKNETKDKEMAEEISNDMADELT